VKASRGGNEYFWEEAEETERLPVEPDAMFTPRFTDRPQDAQLVHFFYEADRGSIVMTDMLKKFRAYHHVEWTFNFLPTCHWERRELYRRWRRSASLTTLSDGSCEPSPPPLPGVFAIVEHGGARDRQSISSTG
jgi:hypothetical protein